MEQMNYSDMPAPPKAWRERSRRQSATQIHDFAFLAVSAGHGGPAACHCFTFATNSSRGIAIGFRPSPGFQRHATNSSFARCSTIGFRRPIGWPLSSQYFQASLPSIHGDSLKKNRSFALALSAATLSPGQHPFDHIPGTAAHSRNFF